MSDTIIYGIKNCGTMKKAFKWLDQKHISYDFHDYKKQGVNETVLNEALNEFGWENVLNRRGTTWRKLPNDVKEKMDNTLASKTALDNPSIIKRPLLKHGERTEFGFKEEIYSNIFS